MAQRLVLFAVWGFLGMVLSYASLYAFTPFGLALIIFVSTAALLMVVVWGSRWPETIGLAAGPGGFSLLLAANSDLNAAVSAVVGAGIICAAGATYVLVMRARCARGRLG